MKINTPLPQPLPKECGKAAIQSFVDSGNNGLDGVIPRTILENAKGFAIFTIFKAGFLFSARAGVGIVIARLDDGTWSAPSAIGTAGLGVGGQAGAEVTDFLVVSNTIVGCSRSFMAAGSLTLGGNMSIAIGPLGRNGEASGSLNTKGKVAAMYSYSKTRGLFGGVSIEGSVIVEREDANYQAYGFNVSAKQLLSGTTVDPPPWAGHLIQTLESCTGMPGSRPWINDEMRGASSGGYAFNGISSSGSTPPRSTSSRSPSSFLSRKKDKSTFPPTSWGDTSGERSSPSSDSDFSPKPATKTSTSFPTYFESPFDPEEQPRFSYYDQNHSRSFSSPAGGMKSEDPFDVSPVPRSSFSSPRSYIAPKPELSRPLMPGEVARAIALYNFDAVENGDLSFKKGDVIIVTEKSSSTDDWWKGRLNGCEGSFPANFVDVV
ncbi:DUF500-domain-containing protein [Fistulina hepatica ATCC 64428]|uniref:DUF500-domain-containing protein n=1 Tax=Fistulina hepatica ATCC 64428 TaxID=1128425 RepID=A0A0D7AQ44_9AGAR|nr:DUF500-domain-containing protein [Fistulina hepatica ATCC 64428]